MYISFEPTGRPRPSFLPGTLLLPQSPFIAKDGCIDWNCRIFFLHLDFEFEPSRPPVPHSDAQIIFGPSFAHKF